MTDLRTTYMGIPLANPIVVGSCSLSKKIDSIKLLEEAGAGALVIKSLFEEQVQIERHEFDSTLGQHDEVFSEALSFFPKIEHGGAKDTSIGSSRRERQSRCRSLPASTA